MYYAFKTLSSLKFWSLVLTLSKEGAYFK